MADDRWTDGDDWHSNESGIGYDDEIRGVLEGWEDLGLGPPGDWDSYSIDMHADWAMVTVHSDGVDYELEVDIGADWFESWPWEIWDWLESEYDIEMDADYSED